VTAEPPERDDDGAYYVKDLQQYVSPDPFVYQVAATALQRQLDRFRDVLTISLGLIAAALASIAFVLVGQISPLDMVVAGILAIGGFVALATVCLGDPQESPKPLTLAAVFEGDPRYSTALATASVLGAIRENSEPLRRKMSRARAALVIILIAAALGVYLKVVESREHGPPLPRQCNLPPVHKPSGEQPTGLFRMP
jgi:hypothetical protein